MGSAGLGDPVRSGFSSDRPGFGVVRPAPDGLGRFGGAAPRGEGRRLFSSGVGLRADEGGFAFGFPGAQSGAAISNSRGAGELYQIRDGSSGGSAEAGSISRGSGIRKGPGGEPWGDQHQLERTFGKGAGGNPAGRLRFLLRENGGG